MPRFSGMATLLRAPEEKDLTKVDVGLIGVPYDGGVTNRPGARHGPREVRTQCTNLVRKFHQATLETPHRESLRVRDIGDAVVTHPYDIVAAHNDIQETFERVVGQGIVPLSVGGDHSVTLPIFRALAKDGPIGMVHLDAHCDTGDDYFGSKFHHGSPFKVAVDEGLLDPKRTIQIGIRGSINDPDMWKFSHDSGMRVVYMEEFYDIVRQHGIQGVLDEAYRVCGVDGPTYISFDVDALDPVYAPGTGTPEVGGLTSLEAQLLLRGLQDMNLIGGDVVEVAPPWDPSGNTAMVGAQMLFEMACVVTQAIEQRRGLK